MKEKDMEEQLKREQAAETLKATFHQREFQRLSRKVRLQWY